MISKLTLGTAQLGQKYGIASKGQPSKETAFKILEIATDNGINCIDTAPYYGNSEKLIGEFYKDYLYKPKVISKINLPTKVTKDNIAKVRLQCVVSELDTGGNGIEYYLVRNAMELGNWYDELLSMKREKFFRNLGVSVYDTKELEYALKFKNVTAFQIPINLFDHRFIPYLGELEGKTVFVRSVYLQGLFFTDKAKKYTDKLEKICKEHGVTVKEAAVTFVRDIGNVTSVVIGAETTTQMLDNIKLMKSPPMTDDLRHGILKEFGYVPEKIIDPRKW